MSVRSSHFTWCIFCLPYINHRKWCHQTCWCCIAVSLFLLFPVTFLYISFQPWLIPSSKVFWILLIVCSPHVSLTLVLSLESAASVHCLFQNHFHIFSYLLLWYSTSKYQSNTISNIIYCYVINYSKTWLLKLVNIYLFTIFMVKNPASLGNSGLRSLMRLKLNFWLGMKSTEGLTGAGRFASKMTHLQDCWQKASICHWLFGRRSEFLITYPIHRAVWVFMAADFLQNKWFKKEEKKY